MVKVGWMGLVAVLVCCVGCGASTPRQAAEGYLGALGRLDFEGAAGYLTDGRTTMELLRKIYSTLGPDEQKKFVVADWTVTGETLNGDQAVVSFTFDGAKQGQLSLKKTPGGWKVEHRTTF